MLLSRVFTYVDKNFLKGNTMPSLGQVCQTAFKEKVIQDNKALIMDALLEEIAKDRRDEAINKDIVKHTI